MSAGPGGAGPSEHTYRYQPLDATKREIRVISFGTPPADDAATAHLVHCTLQVVSLDDLTEDFRQVCSEEACLGGSYVAATASLLNDYRWDAQQSSLRSVSPAAIPLPRWRLESEYLLYQAAALDIDTNNVPPLPEDMWLGIPPDRAIAAEIDAALAQRGTEGQRLVRVEPRFLWGDFEAVSYRWGSDERTDTVILDGHRVAVPRNIEAVVRRLASLPEASRGMHFWVDALCIDQDNTHEKNHQVALMRSIYASALAVVAWLGPAADDSDRACDVLLQMARVLESERRAARPWSWTDEAPLWEYWDRASYEAWFASLPWPALIALLSRAYWSRLWIIQELALNHNMTLILCGERQLSRRLLEDVAVFCRDHSMRIGRLLEREQGGGIAQISPVGGRTTYDLVDRVRSLLSLVGPSEYAPIVLDLGRRAAVKESKDKIYGLLGILPDDLASQVVPDYSNAITRDDVYLDFATTLLTGEGRLDALLSWCTFSDESTLPSWCPDWEVRFPRNHLQYFKKRKACGDTLPEYQISEDRRRLSCRGFVIDSLVTLSASQDECLPYGLSHQRAEYSRWDETLSNAYGDELAVCRALQKTLFIDHPGRHPDIEASAFEPECASNVYWVDWEELRSVPADEPQAQKFWQVMEHATEHPWWQSYDRFRQTNSQFSVFGRPFRDFFPTLSPTVGHSSSSVLQSPRPISNGDRRDMQLVCLTLIGRRLATTTKGYIALVPEASQADDLIAILHGCAFPVILRPVDDSFHVVGECYVEGLMDGEALLVGNALSRDSDPFLVLS